MIDSHNVAIYGGLIGDEANETVFVLNLEQHAWSSLSLSAGEGGAILLPRDDFSLASMASLDAEKAGFVIFGGFVKGTRVNELLSYSVEGSGVSGIVLQGDKQPVPRAGTAIAAQVGQLWMFGGQGDDNTKLNDLWRYDMEKNSWNQVEQKEGEFWPNARSGHTLVTWLGKLFVFGGILELTKELGDLAVFNIATNTFTGSD